LVEQEAAGAHVVLDRHANGVWERIGKFGPTVTVSE